jgi:hypothetical protein
MKTRLPRLRAGCSLVALMLAVGLLPAAETNVPSVSPDSLAVFMAKWQGYETFKFPTNKAEQPLLLAALAKDPNGPWYAYLAMQFTDTRFQLRSLKGQARQEAAAKSVTTLKAADQILAAAIKQGGTNAANMASAQAMLQQTLSPFLLEAGPAYLPEARAMGQRMLDHLPTTNSWDYGNVVFSGNELLGRVALRESKLDEARSYLRAAGRAPSSPQLGSFGPELTLPRELLEHGDPADREAVLGFLDDIAHFWAHPIPGNANSQRVSEDHLKQLETWRQEIRAGQIPNDPKWR